MKHEQFNRFLLSHLSRVEPMSREAYLAYWAASISGEKKDFERYAELEVTYNKTYADEPTFRMLRGWLESGSVTDPLEKRQLDILYRRYLRNQVPADLIERIGKRSSEISNRFNVYRAAVDGKQLTGNEVRSVLRESTDSQYRRRVWEAEKAVGRVVREDLLELVSLRNEAAVAAGFDDHYTMSLRLSEQDPDEIMSLFDELDERSRGPFTKMKSEIDAILSDMYGVSPDGLLPWHYHDPFFQETPRVLALDLDRYYRDHDVVELVAGFFDGIGLEVRDILERSDLYEKPGKEQHAYCLDIDRRGDIRVLANVRNEEMWAGTMLHELGHAIYDRYIDDALPYLLREHAHIFVTESIAMLFGRLSKDADWIQRTVGISDTERASIEPALLRSQAWAQLVFAQWCQVMVRFERSLYRDPGQDLDGLWWDLVERHQLLTRPPGRSEPDWASKIHVVSHPAYYHNYMLGELLASQLDHVIQTRVLNARGERVAMNGHPEVGRYLIENVFRPGNRIHWDGLVRAATGEPLTPRYFVGQFIPRS
jgi:peptidyl-dipeptidase A